MKEKIFYFLFFTIGLNDLDSYAKFSNIKIFDMNKNINKAINLDDSYETLTEQEKITIVEETNTSSKYKKISKSNYTPSKRSFFIQYIIISAIIIAGQFSFLEIVKSYFSDYETSSYLNNLISTTTSKSLLIEKDILAILSYNPTFALITKQDSMLNEKFLFRAKINRSKNHLKLEERFFSKDLANSSKLMNSDQLDLVKEKVISLTIKEKDIKDFKDKVFNIVLNLKQRKNFSSIQISNVSNLLRKPTIMINIFMKNQKNIISLIYLSDFLDHYFYSIVKASFVLVNSNGDLIYGTNIGDTIFKKNISTAEYFKKIKEMQIDNGLFFWKNTNENYLVSYSKINNLDLIFINLSKEENLTYLINQHEQRFNIIVIIIIFLTELFLFIYLRKIRNL
ncbi:hypothetical protein LPTSP3_g31350 [Leptospira kobayashii]|uniref:Uncharacterized protein n=1 Tax=Leptospira kobayashii TaxID=1917830 RepID=A0ABM7UMC5_9LEPT|nr:hypothetical protein [Leptospira kobayashii]BDA80205.1 hypothetical protein LPTSP3_g31350 [Leptospira kobayashii]